MKHIKKATLFLLIGGVTLITMSSFSFPSQNELLGSVSPIDIEGIPSTASSIKAPRITPVTLLLVVGFALITAASTREVGIAPSSFNFETENFLISNLD